MRSYYNHIVDDSFQAFLVENASFTPTEEYPVIRADMTPSAPPIKIMPFSKAINYKGDLHSTYICTYSPDKSFERIRKNPKKYISFFKRTAGIIGFDFSVHSDMPLIKQKTQMNDNLSLSYYYGNNSIKLIPNIRCGTFELQEDYLKAFPKNTLIAIGTNGFIKTFPEKCQWFEFIDTIIKELNPTGIIVYGPLNDKMFERFKEKVPIFIYDSWINNRWKEVKNDVNQRRM